ncbi:hypothetical protein KIPB_002641 [Kipferlia bialata]|uniref:Uncharacterized protein n=1 Tax=Kipferlia bialata TaxID=797122 RepID=A0A391NJJ5_9EUKA|nr:hypothetical protein KIPB_002641 [Kipferlia bialata]|eukprot:g2641.t1
MPQVVCVSLSEFYSIAVRQCVDSAHSYKSSLEAEAGGVEAQTSVTLDVYSTDTETVAALRDFFMGIVSAFPASETTTLAYMHGMLDEEGGVLPAIESATTGVEAVAAYERLQALKHEASNGTLSHSHQSRFSLSGDKDAVLLRLTPPSTDSAYTQKVEAAVRDGEADAQFYADVMCLLDDLRDRKARPTSAETFAIALSGQRLRDGVQQPRLFLPLPLPGRDQHHQSLVFVTDAGPDHIKVVVQDR